MCLVRKRAKDVGTAICKSTVVSFLPCFVTFLRFHPYMPLRFLNVFFVTCFFYFFGGEEQFLCRDVLV